MAARRSFPQELRGSVREDKEGWILLRQEGRPHEMGFQNGWHLSGEIADEIRRLMVYVEGACPGWDWALFRHAGEDLYWPRVEDEWREEIQGIFEGASAKGDFPFDLMDIVALNGYLETLYSYHPWLELHGRPDIPKQEERGGCSAFVATGSYTADGRPILAHSTWFAYITAGWNVLRSVHPASGLTFLAQGNPGTLNSGTDFYMNAHGLAVAETTITGTFTFRPEGRPNFVRSREAIQYATSIDEWAARISRDSNGGVANDWLIFDAATDQVGRLELGTSGQVLERTSDGYFAGSNMAAHEIVRKETSFDYDDHGNSPCARQTRWIQLLESHRGRIDLETARGFLADHVDLRTGLDQPSRTTLCGHVEVEETGLIEWGWGSRYPGGALDAKAVDAKGLQEGGSFWARYGKPCGESFDPRDHLKETTDYPWEAVFPDWRLQPQDWVNLPAFD